MDLEGRVAVVTGGGVRVGKALALGLAAAGADVFVHYSRSAGSAADTAAKAEALGVRSAVGSVDLSVPQDSARVIDLAEQALGPVSLLVNSASGFPENTIEDVGFDAWQETLDVTLSAPVFLTKAFADRLPLEMSGAVVNVTDVRTDTPNLVHFSYIVAKGGIDAFTRAAAAGLAPRIRVNAVALGVILPDKDSYAERLATKLPLARVGGTEPVVDTVLFLLRNDFVTGEIVRVDGGGHLK
jgi:glucose 1-dehydrogenase